MWLKLIECSCPFARPLGVKLRCCVRRSGVLAAALLCVRHKQWRRTGVTCAARPCACIYGTDIRFNLCFTEHIILY